jgi:hypothetical protein
VGIAGAFVVPPRFDGVGDFSDGLADPYYTSWNYIGRRGTVVASGWRD